MRIRWFVRLLLPCLLALVICDNVPAHADIPGIEVVPPGGHARRVYVLRFSTDGKTLASASEDGLVLLWNVETGHLIRTLAGGSGEVHALALSPDGRIVAAGSGAAVQLWDAASGRGLGELSGLPDAPTDIAFSPDGSRVAAGCWGAEGTDEPSTVKVWDMATRQVVRSLTGAKVAFNADGISLSVGVPERRHVAVVDLATGRSIRQLDQGSWIKSVAVAPDGRMIAGSGDNREVVFWDAVTGRQVRRIKGYMGQFSADSRNYLTITEAGGIHLVEVSTGRSLRKFGSAGERALAVAMSPDGRTVAGASGDDGSIRLWSSDTGGELRQLRKSPASAQGIAFAPSGASFAIARGDGTVDIRETATAKVLRTIPVGTGSVGALAYAPDGRTLATAVPGVAAIDIWVVAEGKKLRRINTRDPRTGAIAYSSDGRMLAVGAPSSSMVLDAATGRSLLTLPDLVGPGLVFAPDGRLITVADGHGNLAEAVDPTTGRPSWKLAPRSESLFTASITASRQGGLVAVGSHYGTIHLADTSRSGQSWEADVGSDVFALAFAPDGRVLASGDLTGSVRLWDAETGKAVKRLDAHGYRVRALAYSPDGRLLASGAEDSVVRLRRASDGEPLVAIVSTDGGGSITLTPEGFFDATPDAAKLLTVVRGLEVYSIDQVYDQLYRPDLVREKLAGDPKGLVKAAAAKIDLDKAIGSGAPPAVKFVGAPASIAGETVKLEVEATDLGGGIGKVEWRVNGVVTGLGNRGLARVDPVPAPASGASSVPPGGGASTSASGPASAPSSTSASPAGKTQRLTQEVTLVPGENTIEVVAYNAAGLVASRPEGIRITSTASVARGPGKLFVLAIGVNDYFDSRLALNYAVPDAKAIVDGLQAAKGDVYAAVETKLLTDAEVTPQTLEAALSEIGAKAKPQDTFVLFVAGHGKTVDGRYYYLPRDFRYRDETSFATSGIGQAQFQDWLSRVRAQRSVLLFDTCESGSLTEDRPALRGIERAVAMEKMTAAMGRTTIAASTDDQPALEGYRGHGVFTWSILSGLSAADRNGDGRVDVLELIAHLDQEVPELSNRAFKFRQIPQTKFSGSNFALVAKTAIVADAPPAVGAAAIRSRPTHVVITPAEVLAAAGSGATVGRLEPGAQVGVVKTEAGWVLIARDGKPYGYVKEANLVRLQ